MVSNATKDIIKTVYSSNKKLPINKRQLKKIEKFFINNADLTSDIIQAMKQEKSIGDCIDVLKSGKDEIVKQHAKQKGLQSGILSECLIAQTLADIHELEFYEDIETNAPSSTLLSLVKDNKLEHLLGNTRYVYYSQQKEIIIFQCGNPNTNDLHIHLKAGDVISEIKDIPALIQDIDLLYDNNGKLIIPDELRKQSPACAEVIERFNAETDVISSAGQNYQIGTSASDDLCRQIIKEFASNSNAEVLFLLVKNDLIAVLVDDIAKKFSNGKPIFTFKQSEIRTTGKNARATPFAPKLVEDAIREYCEETSNPNILRIAKANDKVIGWKTGRGKKDKTRFKITEQIFVRTKDITETDDYYEFDKSKINQTKSSITVHLNFPHKKEDMKEYYKDIIGTSNCAN